MTDRLADVHPKMLASTPRQSRKDSADEVEARRAVGRLVVRALEIMGRSKQDVSFEMGYRDEGATLSRWCSAVERPHFEKLRALKGFDEALIIAIAERNPNLEGEYLIRIKRPA